MKSTNLLLPVLAALLLSGCVKPIDMSQIQVTSLEVFSWSGSSFCLGRPFQLGVEVTTAEGKKLRTWKKGESKDERIEFDEFSFNVYGAEVDDEGFIVKHQPLATVNHAMDVQVVYNRDRALVATTSLNPRYDCESQAVLAGKRGAQGENGAAGEPGRDGTTGDGGGAAGDGGAGQHGAAGAPGNAGQDGPVTEVRLGMIQTRWRKDVVLIKIIPTQGKRKPSYHLVDAGASEGFLVSIEGGAGGAGGWGGNGGNGGAGGNNVSGSLPGNGGEGGFGGNGGPGGPGGAGAQVTVLCDSNHPELLRWLRFANPGGRGGAGGQGGQGGWGGNAGTSVDKDKDTTTGLGGRPGRDGANGPIGPAGPPGPPITMTTMELDKLFEKEISEGIRFK